ncbi:MAG: hypothetical protein KDK45_06340, partial [Leptospiraceae bacterium]|nr:hypothetical protein [Leptospiraceae bacterium]
MVFFQRTAHYLFFLIALIQALAYRWVCDDAFISFRYARNLTKGLGLVFNEGERVEGYTNFLWTLLLSLGFQFKLNPIPYSENLGVLFYLGTLFVTYYFAKKINARQRNYFPIAFCGLAVHKYMHTFASSGLETSFFTFLVLSAYYYVFLAEDLKPRLIAFTLLNLAALTRPEGLLYYFVAAFYIYYLDIKNGILYRGSTGKEILLRSLHHIPFLIIYIPYFIWKYNYYGFLLPNTYYAKSGGGIYFSQGWKYLEIFCDAYYFLYTLPFFLILYLFRLRKERNTHRNFLLIFIAPLLHLLYILKVGGDFMFARFFIPLLP